MVRIYVSEQIIIEGIVEDIIFRMKKMDIQYVQCK